MLAFANLDGVLYRPIFDVITTQQQGDWCIMADTSKIRINDSMVINVVMKVDRTL